MQSGTALRIAGWQDGERRLTNLLHLFELLENAAQQRGGMGPVLAWYRSELDVVDGGEDDERLMRLESDAARVRLLTVHAAKGLEFPLVFCPFLWNGQLFRVGEAPLFHDAEGAVLDLGSAQFASNQALARDEKLAEKLRLLYVALTRAMCACYVSWGSANGIETSALAWLLAGGVLQKRDAEALHGEVDALIAASGDAMAWCDELDPAALISPPIEPSPIIEVAALHRPLLWQWRMSSFSALTAGLHEERPDYDTRLLTDTVELAPAGRFAAFPAGPRAGVCLHALFERWDFNCRDRQALEALAALTLQAHAIDTAWVPMATALVEATLSTPLAGGHCLRDVAPADRLIELEFTYPLRPFTWRELSAVLADPTHALPAWLIDASRRLDTQLSSGYLKGFIDLTCRLDGRHYIVDWKSNRLDDYAADSLAHEMAAEHYYLQALIYCVALHRYLRWRQPDYAHARDFGGALYLFLRGLDPALAGQGIWSLVPSLALITALEEVLCG